MNDDIFLHEESPIEIAAVFATFHGYVCDFRLPTTLALHIAPVSGDIAKVSSEPARVLTAPRPKVAALRF